MIEFYTKQYRYGVVEPATILLTALPSPPTIRSIRQPCFCSVRLCYAPF